MGGALIEKSDCPCKRRCQRALSLSAHVQRKAHVCSQRYGEINLSCLSHLVCVWQPEQTNTLPYLHNCNKRRYVLTALIKYSFVIPRYGLSLLFCLKCTSLEHAVEPLSFIPGGHKL